MIIWILSVLERLPSRSRIISRPIAETTDVPVCSSATRKLKPRKESPLAARFLGSARVKRRIKASYTGSREAQLLHACPRNHLERPPYASRVHTREFTCRTGGCACVRARARARSCTQARHIARLRVPPRGCTRCTLINARSPVQLHGGLGSMSHTCRPSTLLLFCAQAVCASAGPP
jgi:hypothetical protein